MGGVMETRVIDTGNNDHFFCMLGTTVNYYDTPQFYPPFFKHGETLSVIAKLITSMRGEENATEKRMQAALTSGNAHYAHPFTSPSVDVINGADREGFEVGHRIAKALMLALDVIEKGKPISLLLGLAVAQ